MKKIQLMALFSLIALVAGCGGGSSTTASVPTASTASVSGTVADGYLVNATVFLDKNLNYQLDAGEPSVSTDANGTFTLTIDPTDVGKYPIVALATQGVTVDTDTNTPVAASYLLCIPAASVVSDTGTVSGTVSNFISPMSTMVRELMETGQYATMQQAMEALRTQLGLAAGTNMMDDYMRTQTATHTAMHTAAQNMVQLMQSQMTQIMGSGTTPVVDVNRYRAMMGMMYSNMATLNGTVNQQTMTTMMNTMNTKLMTISGGMPFRNMSTAFRGGM